MRVAQYMAGVLSRLCFRGTARFSPPRKTSLGESARSRPLWIRGRTLAARIFNMPLKHTLATPAMVLGFLLSFNSVYAQDSSARIFEQANAFYKENKFDQAIMGYDEIIERGFENGNVYYNLGNSYLKKGELGKAILNYERARIFMPSDGDLKSNYEYACSNAGLDKATNKAISRIFAGLGIDSLAVILFILQGAIFIILAILSFPRKRESSGMHSGFYRMAIVFLSAAFILTGWSFKRKLDWLNKGAVVIVREAEARFEPLEGSTAHFTLKQGSPVEILDKSPAWLKARRIDGKKGWVKKEDVEWLRL